MRHDLRPKANGHRRRELLLEARRNRPTRKRELTNQLKLTRPEVPPAFITVMDELDAMAFHDNGDCIELCPFD